MPNIDNDSLPIAVLLIQIQVESLKGTSRHVGDVDIPKTPVGGLGHILAPTFNPGLVDQILFGANRDGLHHHGASLTARRA